MAVYRRGYQRYQGPLTPHWQRVLAMPRYAWKDLMEQRLVIILLSVSFIWPLLCAGFIYVSNHTDLWQGFAGRMSRLLAIDASFFVTFMDVQAAFAMMLAALAGPGLLAPDLANNALPLYFSRPLSRLDYVLSRWLVLGGLLSLVTWLPALLLIVMQGSLAGWNWVIDQWRLPVGLIVGFAFWILLVSLVAMACSAYVKWKIVAGALVLGFFFLLAGVAKMVNTVFRVEWGSLLNPVLSLYYIWCALLGKDTPDSPTVAECWLALGVLAVLLALVLERKIRPVEVIK